MTFLALTVALEATVVIAWFGSFVPYPAYEFISTLFPHHQQHITPEREQIYYFIFIAIAVVVQAGGLWLVHYRLTGQRIGRALAHLVMMQTVWAALLLFVYFKVYI